MRSPEQPESSPRLGNIVKALRQERGWSLADLSQRCGITPSTLSKVERSQLSLTYDRILQLANGLGVAVDQLFRTSEQTVAPIAITRRSINRRGDSQTTEVIETKHYLYRYLNIDLLGKQQNPIITKLLCRSIKEFGEKISHKGEEFTYVLKGTVSFICDYYAPATLDAGDSVYFDSSIPHAYLNAGEGEAEVLTICTQIDPENNLPS
jgi:transcriptional regulator with XRE-family HTH domain